MKGGWYIAHKGRLEFIRDQYGPVAWAVMHYALETAVHIEQVVPSKVCGGTDIRLQRGEALISHASMAKKIGATEHSVKQAVRKLCRGGRLTTRRSVPRNPKSPTVLKVVDYDSWHKSELTENQYDVDADFLSREYREQVGGGVYAPIAGVRVGDFKRRGFDVLELGHAIARFRETRNVDLSPPTAAEFFASDDLFGCLVKLSGRPMGSQIEQHSSGHHPHLGSADVTDLSFAA